MKNYWSLNVTERCTTFSTSVSTMNLRGTKVTGHSGSWSEFEGRGQSDEVL